MNIKILLPSILTTLAFIPSFALAEFKLVRGNTSNGGMLALETSTVGLVSNEVSRGQQSVTIGYYRVFDYYSIDKKGNQRKVSALTPWCTKGKVKFDPNAYDAFNMGAIIAKSPAWMTEDANFSHKIIKADSPASINLLKAVCAADAVKK